MLPLMTHTIQVGTMKRKAYSAIGCLQDLPMMSLETGIKIFGMKTTAPILTYAIGNITPFLTLAHLKDIDKIKTTFVKRLLSLHLSMTSPLMLCVNEEPSFSSTNSGEKEDLFSIKRLPSSMTSCESC